MAKKRILFPLKNQIHFFLKIKVEFLKKNCYTDLHKIMKEYLLLFGSASSMYKLMDMDIQSNTILGFGRVGMVAIWANNMDT